MTEFASDNSEIREALDRMVDRLCEEFAEQARLATIRLAQSLEAERAPFDVVTPDGSAPTPDSDVIGVRNVLTGTIEALVARAGGSCRPTPSKEWGPPRPAGVTYVRLRDGALVVASRWSRNGDHPQDGSPSEDVEGSVVRRYRPPAPDGGNATCDLCGRRNRDHGWIDNVATVRSKVCPGDYVIHGLEAGPLGPFDSVSARTLDREFALTSSPIGSTSMRLSGMSAGTIAATARVSLAAQQRLASALRRIVRLVEERNLMMVEDQRLAQSARTIHDIATEEVAP